MNKKPEGRLQWSENLRAVGDAAAGGFRLVRYFSATALVAFAIVAAALYLLERQESIFFRTVQETQGRFVAQVQKDFVMQHERLARRDLLAVHEASHVNLTQLMGNALWASHIEPFVQKAQQMPIEPCRAAPAAAEAEACYAEVRRRILALPEFSRLDAQITQAMRGSTVFKVKVFDIRGMTVYSSEHGQVGEDRRENEGWRAAAAGKAASELTHRDRFSAFEGVVEHRDLISSYVPVYSPERPTVAGVFEVYSDVTPFLERINRASAEIRELAAANLTQLAQAAAENQRIVDESSRLLLAIVGGLLLLLYVALLLVVRRAQRILDAQALAQRRASEREARRHQERMAAMAAMAQSLSHEIGNPLATVVAVTEDMADRQRRGEPPGDGAQVILEQARRIAEKTRQIADFTAARSERLEPVDANAMIRSVCDFLGFDRRFASVAIEFRPGSELPVPVVIPDNLTEAVMNLLAACVPDAEDARPKPDRIVVETEARGAALVIRVRHDGPADAGDDSAIDAARRRVTDMGGQLTVGTGAIEIELPPGEL